MKQLLLLITSFFSLLTYCQVQLGQDIEGENFGDFCGYSVAMNSTGDIVAIGATRNDPNNINSAGHVRVYQNQSGSWVQIGNDIDGIEELDQLGFSLSLNSDGTRLVVGAIEAGTVVGYAKVFENVSGNWTQLGNDIDGGFLSGYSVSINSTGNIIAIGDAFFGEGRVKTFIYQGGDWIQLGSDLFGEQMGDRFGLSVDLNSDGTILAIGAPNANTGGNFGNGAVSIYEFVSNDWVQIGSKVNGNEDFAEFGFSLSLNATGNTIVIGAPYSLNNFNDSGYTAIYENQQGNWTLLGSEIIGEANRDRFGFSVDISQNGELVAIGAPTNSNLNGDTGHTRIFQFIGDVWVQVGQDIDGEVLSNNSGFSVALSQNTGILAIGDPLNDGNGFDSGHVRVYDLSNLLSSDDVVLSQFSLNPNPAKNQFNVTLGEGLQLQNINIYNNLGQFILSTKDTTVNTSSLNSGMYFVEIETNSGKATKKLILE
jgi:hypothetical protein